MTIKKLLLGVALLIFGSTISIQSIKAEEWVNPNGTERGFSYDFCYIVETNYNKTNQNGTIVDEAKEAGGEYRTLSDGKVWISKGYSSIVKVVNALGNTNPLTKVEVADTSIATVSRKTTGAISQTNNEYTIVGKDYGNTYLTVTRKNGDSFTVPINVVPLLQIQNDEGRNERTQRYYRIYCKKTKSGYSEGRAFRKRKNRFCKGIGRLA